MKVGVIHYRLNPPESVLDLIRAGKELGVDVQYLRIQGLDATIESGQVKVRYRGSEPDMGGYVLRGVGLFLGLEAFMKRIGVLEALSEISTVINDPLKSLVARDKWRSLLALARSGVPVPDTLVTESPLSAMAFVEKRKKAVVKPLMGSLGLGSALIEDPDIAFYTTKSLLSVGSPSYYQAFLEKPGYDFRVFVVGDRVVGAMKRVIEGKWKTNIAQGARGAPVRQEEYPEVFEIAVKASRALGLDYCGADVAYDVKTDKYYVLEVNAFPQWKGLRAATGVDPSLHILEHLLEKIKK